MNKKQFLQTKKSLLEKMAQDNYSNGTIRKYDWIISHFEHYCEKNGIDEITLSSAADFIRECFGFEMLAAHLPLQSAIRYPLLSFFEFSQNGSYAKRHQSPSSVDIPPCFGPLFQEYRTYIDGCGFKRGTRLKRLLIFAKYLSFLDGINLQDTLKATKQTAYDFIGTMKDLAPKTVRGYKVQLKFALNWLYDNRYSSFSGNQLLPAIHCKDRNSLISYYSADEVAQILDSVDTSKPDGKLEYGILCLLAYLGIRAGDIAALRFENINWNNNTLSFTQFKTGDPLTLPLLDEVKYPLIDYIKNARPDSPDSGHVFIKRRAPYACYPDGNGIYAIVSRCIKKSGVEIKGRHFGPHALRHSLATNLLSENVPVSGISDILGHASTVTTEIYLTTDETHLKELSLEVPANEG